MHEFSIAESLVKTAVDEIRKADTGNKGKVLVVRVVVGELRQVVSEYLSEAFRLLSEGTPTEGARLEIDSRKATGKCRKCGSDGNLEAGIFLCGKCGEMDCELKSGKELYLESIEIETEKG